MEFEASRHHGKEDVLSEWKWPKTPFLERCLMKVAQRQGVTEVEHGEWLKRQLEHEFRQYHETQKARTPLSFNFDEMSGSQFEVWVRRLCEKSGYEVPELLPLEIKGPI